MDFLTEFQCGLLTFFSSISIPVSRGLGFLLSLFLGIISRFLKGVSKRLFWCFFLYRKFSVQKLRFPKFALIVLKFDKIHYYFDKPKSEVHREYAKNSKFHLYFWEKFPYHSYFCWIYHGLSPNLIGLSSFLQFLMDGLILSPLFCLHSVEGLGICGEFTLLSVQFVV